MHGKTVRIRHCPATVSGQQLPCVCHCVGRTEVGRQALRRDRKSGDRFSGNLVNSFPRGKGSWPFSPSCFFCSAPRQKPSKGPFWTPVVLRFLGHEWKS